MADNTLHFNTEEYNVGDEISIVAPKEVTINDMCFFDEIEYDCYELFKKYCDLFGFEIIDADEAGIDFHIAKGIQEKILGMFEEAGVNFNYYGQEADKGNVVEELLSEATSRVAASTPVVTGKDDIVKE